MNHTTLLTVAVLAAAAMFAGLNTALVPAHAQSFTGSGDCTITLPGVGPVGGTATNAQLGLPSGIPGASALPSLGASASGTVLGSHCTGAANFGPTAAAPVPEPK
jgi:hypothetical protein